MKQISAAAALLIGAKAIKYVPENASVDADKPLYYTVPEGWWPSEKAALNAKGVKYASWDLKTHQLSLIIDENKTGTKIIQQNIAAVGHDTKGIRAKDHAYNQIDPCCKYRDKNVVESHKN